MARFWKLQCLAVAGEYEYIDPSKIIAVCRDTDGVPSVTLEGDAMFYVTEGDFTALRAWAERDSEYPPVVEEAEAVYAGGGWK